MFSKFALSAIALLTVGLLCVPAAVAQPPPAKVVVTLISEHAEMNIDPGTGRHDMTIIVKTEAIGFTCAQPLKYNMDISMLYKGQWAGASLQPPRVDWEYAANEPNINGPPVVKQKETVLNAVWDLETAPKKGAETIYNLRGKDAKVDPAKAGPCFPNLPNFDYRPLDLRATMPDRTDPNVTGGEESCQDNPFQPKCQTSTSAPPEGSPGFDAALLVLSVVGITLFFARRRKA